MSTSTLAFAIIFAVAFALNGIGISIMLDTLRYGKQVSWVGFLLVVAGSLLMVTLIKVVQFSHPIYGV